MSFDPTRRPADETTAGSTSPAGIDDTTSDPAALLAHELETPLAIIQTAVSLALEQEPDEEDQRRRLLEMIRRNGDLASLVVRRLGAARDLEMGALRLDRRRVDLGMLGRRGQVANWILRPGMEPERTSETR
jgi:hypothetical protein